MTFKKTLARCCLAVGICLLLAAPTLQAMKADPLPLMLKIGRDHQNQGETGQAADTILVLLKIEILHKHPHGTKSLKADKISIPAGSWATYTLSPSALKNQPYNSLSVKLRPTLLSPGKDTSAIRFDIRIFQDGDMIKQQAITTGSHEAVMLELMEDPQSGSKILLKAAGSPRYPSPDLKHALKVEVKIIPMFAVDSKGKPVLDLKQADLSLLINDEKVPFQFYRFTSEEVLGDQRITVKKRNIFIVIDSLFKTEHGFSLSKEIVEKLVADAFSDDLITILEISPMGGLRHIYGPSSHKTRLIQKIRELKQFPDHFMTIPEDTHFPAVVNREGEEPEPPAKSGRNRREKEARMNRKTREIEAEYGKWTAIFYIKTLQKLQHILKMTENRKMVFLVSQGTPHRIFVDRKQMDFVREALNSINNSETILYTIYPKRETYAELRHGVQTGDSLLRYLSQSAGGKYFEGSDPNVIVKEVKRTTSAYYELIFSPTPEMGKTQTVRIKSTRPGVKFFYIQNTSKPLPYRKMSLVEKKIFALDAVSKGRWSRRIASVREIPNEIVIIKRKNLQKIKISVPPQMVKKKCDVFFLNINLQSRNNAFVVEKRKFKKQHTFVLERKDGFQTYIIIVEPESARCIYTEIK
jgi:VWFA-related protein